MRLLETSRLTKHFGGLAAVNDLTFHIEKGDIFGMIGPNGAGKTTAFNLITGVLSPTLGRVIYRNQDITKLRTSKIAEMGIVRTWQVSSLFANMTVLQSILIGCHLCSRIGFWEAIFGSSSKRRKENIGREKAMEILDLMGLTQYKDVFSKYLPHGLQRRLGIGIALGADPELLLLDEPVAGMNPEETLQSMELVKELNRKGITILLVEHNMRAVMTTCHRIIVIHYGRKIAEGRPEEIVENEKVIQAYLGGAAKVA